MKITKIEIMEYIIEENGMPKMLYSTIISKKAKEKINNIIENEIKKQIKKKEKKHEKNS